MPILAIDQGTTSSRALVFSDDLQVQAVAQQEFDQHFPRSGWVEHDADEIWASAAAVARAAVERAGNPPIASIGITNQRETTVIWDRHSGRPIHNAIVWQDRRTAEHCRHLREQGHEDRITDLTGLLLDPYFSATKIAWLLDHVDGARDAARRGDLLFGTIDSWLIWKLTGGRSHVTDATNASRTLLFDIHAGTWSDELCELFGVPASMLPELRDCADDFGQSRADLFGREIPICGVAGDQQAATVGQACFTPGMLKSTYGTGCFALLNTGEVAVRSQNRLLTTVAYRLNGRPTYALEGSIFVAGAVVQWLRDGLGLIRDARQTQPLAESAEPSQDVVLVPAFTGLGAPYWHPESRGAIFGITRNTGPAELARAALQSVGFQTRDLLEAMRSDWTRPSEATDRDERHSSSTPADVLRVDGGMATSDWTMQFLADILGAPVDRPAVTETTALGAAYLAGLQCGVCPEPETFGQRWQLERRFSPRMAPELRDASYERWRRAVAATMTV
ncbi:glycerol kinase GlpK [uncultured Paracoccus sp.]|uniref:glycerol kinase GlpK n=1 Tax=uncultured Paracoccus sp. TaxID=189685 RepID=UPI00262A9766|nr:glycerol kinase GlpK [uncultured Paracoccus sp.]